MLLQEHFFTKMDVSGAILGNFTLITQWSIIEQYRTHLLFLCSVNVDRIFLMPQRPGESSRVHVHQNRCVPLAFVIILFVIILPILSSCIFLFCGQFYKSLLLIPLFPFFQSLWSNQIHKLSYHSLFTVAMPLCALMLAPIFKRPYTDFELGLQLENCYIFIHPPSSIPAVTEVGQNLFQSWSRASGSQCSPLFPLLCTPVYLFVCVCVFTDTVSCSGYHPLIEFSAPICLPYTHWVGTACKGDVKALLPSLFIRYHSLYIWIFRYGHFWNVPATIFFKHNIITHEPTCTYFISWSPNTNRGLLMFAPFET